MNLLVSDRLSGVMVGDTPHASRQPKLRSSCDGCGAAKLKCDRSRPECGRCVSLYIPCVYGVKRKMGKPPQERHSQGAHPTAASPESARRPPAADHGNNAPCAEDAAETSVMLDLGPFPNLLDWNDLDCANGFEISLGTLDGLHNDLWLGPPPHPPLPAPAPTKGPDCRTDLGEWVDSELARGGGLLSRSFGNESIHDNRVAESSGRGALPGICSKADKTPRFSDHGPLPPPTRGHDCAAAAHKILRSISFPHLSQARFSGPTLSGTVSAPTTAAGGASPGSIPLDHVLGLTREASEGLGRLLDCSCAQSPPLVLLYASIISRILVWYQHAIASSGLTPSSHAQNTCSPTLSSRTPEPMALGTATEMSTALSPSSDSGSGPEFSVGTWPSTVGSTVGDGSGSSSAARAEHLSNGDHVAVAPTRMAIGTFNVDDLGVQAALNVQLLAGEMRRAGLLIDRFTNREPKDGGRYLSSTGGPTFGGLDGLYGSLDQWLRGEHLRITNGVRSKLRELNT